VGAALDEDDRPDLEVDEVLGLDVEAEEAVEAVGTAESPGDETPLSR